MELIDRKRTVVFLNRLRTQMLEEAKVIDGLIAKLVNESEAPATDGDDTQSTQ